MANRRIRVNYRWFWLRPDTNEIFNYCPACKRRCYLIDTRVDDWQVFALEMWIIHLESDRHITNQKKRSQRAKALRKAFKKFLSK